MIFSANKKKSNIYIYHTNNYSMIYEFCLNMFLFGLQPIKLKFMKKIDFFNIFFMIQKRSHK